MLALAVVGLCALVFVVVVVVVVTRASPPDSSNDGANKTSAAYGVTMDPAVFPEASQSEFDAAVRTTCDSARRLIKDGTTSAMAFATFIRTSSRETIVKNGWVQHTNDSQYDHAMVKNQEVALETTAFFGPSGPCSDYEDSYNQVSDILNSMP